jgi:head-tail adaptor
VFRISSFGFRISGRAARNTQDWLRIMPLFLDLADDLSACDGLQSVTLRQPGETDGVGVSSALVRSLTREEREASGGRYQASDCVWRLPAAGLPVAPQLGATIADTAGESWTVLEVQAAALGAQWRCLARNLALLGGLDERITLQRAAWDKDADGAPVAVWSDCRVGLRARVQPVTTKPELDQDRRRVQVRYRVFVAEAPALAGDYRLVRGEEVLSVTAIERPARIDELTVLLAEPI